MERLTDCAQGYCEMYCKKYGHCFGDPGDCIFKDEIKLYEAVKSIEGIVPFDRLLELADADRAGKLVVLPCKVGAPVYTTHWWKDVKEKCTDSHGKPFYRMASKKIIKKERFDPFGPHYEWLGKTVFLTREEAEEAMEQEGGTNEDSGSL